MENPLARTNTRASTRRARANPILAWLDPGRIVDALFREDWLWAWQLDAALAEGELPMAGAARESTEGNDAPAFDAALALQGENA